MELGQANLDSFSAALADIDTLAPGGSGAAVRAAAATHRRQTAAYIVSLLILGAYAFVNSVLAPESLVRLGAAVAGTVFFTDMLVRVSLQLQWGFSIGIAAVRHLQQRPPWPADRRGATLPIQSCCMNSTGVFLNRAVLTERGRQQFDSAVYYPRPGAEHAPSGDATDWVRDGRHAKRDALPPRFVRRVALLHGLLLHVFALWNRLRS